MSYMALYRKWRPKNFDEVKGQEAVCTTLKNQIKLNRIGHSYLFCGTRGTGKTSIAKIMAKAVNCENNEDGNPCNECAVCKAIAKESSINVYEIDAASNNGVDNIRDIKEQVQYPPTEGRYRVFIIDEVHMLSTGAFNALLKTLEEPPEYVIFILATTEVHKIPVTVLSRCQRYDFRRINSETIVTRLKDICEQENIAIEDKGLEYIAKNSDGAMRDALSLLDECIAFYPDENITYEKMLEVFGSTDISVFCELFDAIINIDINNSLKIIEEIVIKGREIGQFVIDYLWYLRNLLIIKSSKDAWGIIDASKENIEIMQRDAAKASKESLIRYIKIFSELSNQIKFSEQKRILLELAIIKLSTPSMEMDVDSLFERISRLEKNVENKAFVSIGSVSKSAVKSEEKQQDKIISLPKAQYDDFMKIRGEWHSIMAGLSGSLSSIYKDVGIEACEGGAIELIFTNEGFYKLGSRENSILELTNYINDIYSKRFEFITKLKNNKDISNTKYVSEEEISSVVKIDIEIEDIG